MMNLAFEQSLLGFDLDLLHDPSNNAVAGSISEKKSQELEKSIIETDDVSTSSTVLLPKKPNVGRNKKNEKGIGYLKKKIIDIDNLVEQYHARYDQLAKLERNLFETKDKFRETCIERDLYRKNCENLEKECEKLRIRTQQLEQKVLHNDHIKAASESHMQQLQVLIKERDVQLEDLKVDKHIKIAAIKDLEKSIGFLKKHKEFLITQLCNVADVVFTKRILAKKDKIALSKYMRLKRQRNAAEGIEKPIYEEENSDSDTEGCEDVPLSDSDDLIQVFSPRPVKQHECRETDHEKEDNDGEFDTTSEMISVDTGRGSSLAFSGSEKVDSSPEYETDSPPCQSNEIKYIDPATSAIPVKRSGGISSIDSATSPIPIKQSVDIATSPILFEALSPYERKGKTLYAVTDNPKKTVEKALSPMRIPEIVVSSNLSIDGIEPLSPIIEQSYLDLNNGTNLINDSINDCEVEMILNTMKLNDGLITPMPPTPGRLIGTKSRSSNIHASECPEAAKASKENKALQSAFVELATEVMSLREKVNNLTVNMVCQQPVVNQQNEKTLSHSVGNQMSKSLIIEEQDSTHTSNLDKIFEIIAKEDNKSLRDKVSNLTVNMVCQEPVNQQNENTLSHSVGNQISKSLIIEEQDSIHTSNLDKIFEIIAKEDNYEKSSQRTDPILHTNISENLQFEDDSSDLQLCNREFITDNDQISEPATDHVTLCNNTERKRTPKVKLSRLEKLRKNMIPKNKIKRSVPLPRMLRLRKKRILFANHNQTKKSESARTLNEKDVYERAVKVMAEINCQQKTVTPKKVNKSRKMDSEDTFKLSGKTPEKTSVKSCQQTADSPKEKENISEQENNKIINNNVAVSVTDTTKDINERLMSPIQSPIKDGTNICRRKSLSPEIESVLSKTRKRYPSLSLDKDIVVVLERSEMDDIFKRPERKIEVAKVDTTPCNTKTGACVDKETLQNKRSLRSAMRTMEGIEPNDNKSRQHDLNVPSSPKPDLNATKSKIVSYNDLDVFNDEPPLKKQRCQDIPTCHIQSPQQSILCRMIDKYGAVRKKSSKKVPDSVVNSISTTITENIAHVCSLPQMEAKDAMDKIIIEMQRWQFKDFMAGLMQYLMDPTRKLELLNKISGPPAPPMTKSEQVLLYLVTRLRWDHVHTVDRVLKQIEYVLFRLNQTPVMKVVESMSHFYAILCRYIGAKSRLRLFVLNAMYSMQYSAVALIKQCIEVWMHILPLAHMGTAKSPVVATLVYLLHFYKCDDATNKVQDIRNILKHKYFFNIGTDWDETKILDMFKNSILEMKDNSIEMKMLRLALILLSKRQGAKWCQNKIIKGMLLPIIAKENIPERVKAFCISMLGPLFKPYPDDMRVHCEIIVNQFSDMLEKNPSPLLEEAIYSSLISMGKHNQSRIIQTLLSWRPTRVTPHMESILKDYVKEKPEKAWKTILSKVSLNK